MTGARRHLVLLNGYLVSLEINRFSLFASDAISSCRSTIRLPSRRQSGQLTRYTAVKDFTVHSHRARRRAAQDVQKTEKNICQSGILRPFGRMTPLAY